MTNKRIIVWLTLLLALSCGPARAEDAPPRYLPAAPAEVILCQENMPLDDQFMAEALDREFNIAVHDQAQVVMWLKRARRYFPHISKRLAEAGMPDDLKYLAVAESGLLHKVGSSAGAVGVWQFMPQTGMRYGLRVDDWMDERRSFHKSTEAALRYLRDLHDEFGSWTLAMAAYNCGEARIRRELKEQAVATYYDLQLPEETMRYIFRIASAKAVLEDPRKYGYCLPDDQLYAPLDLERATLRLNHATHLRDLAGSIGTTLRRMRDLNPEIIQHTLPAGSYALLVPTGSAAALEQAAGGLPACRIDRSDECRPAVVFRQKLPAKPASVAGKPAKPAAKGRTWVVKKGETLIIIAKRTGVSVEALRRANNISGNKIGIGQRLSVPAK